MDLTKKVSVNWKDYAKSEIIVALLLYLIHFRLLVNQISREFGVRKFR